MSESTKDAAQNPDTQDVEYNLPRNNAAEHARLNDQAAGYTELMENRIIHSPLQHPTKILDVGCGTGIVTRHLGTLHPTASIYGIDLSPIPSPTPSSAISSTPPNVTYIIGDIRALAFSDARLQAGTFDCVFQRLLICGMTNWQSYVEQMTRLLRPGGWLEIHDYAERWYSTHESGRMISGEWKWQQAMRRGAEELGLDLDIGLHAQDYMRKAGLVDVKVEKYMVPFGTWMADERPETRRIGGDQSRDLGGVFSGSVLPGVTRGLGLGEVEMEELKGECRRCLGEEEGKYWWFYVTVGRKGVC